MSHAAVTVLPLGSVPKAKNENVWTVVVAGGSGSRFGTAKQYEAIGGRRMLDLSVDAALRHSSGVVIVVPAADVVIEQGLGSVVVAGGATRSESVRAGLSAVPAAATIVCVHDAARPFASDGLFVAVIDAVTAGADAAIPGVPVTDTIKLIDERNVVVDTPQRDRLVAVQTPQAFRASVLRFAHADGGDGTDDAALVEATGGRVVAIPGEVDNRKITHPDDLVWARAKVDADEGGPVRGQGSMNVRVGQGFDIHRFSDDPVRRLVLGGVHFEGARGLVGHSDADVIAHAVADALLGAAGLGDIGEHFSDNDARWAGADSLLILREVAALVAAKGWRVGNVDCSVVCEAPKLAPRRNEMQGHLSDAAGAPVTVKGRRAEGLGALGRREGIACWAVAVIAER